MVIDKIQWDIFVKDLPSILPSFLFGTRNPLEEDPLEKTISNNQVEITKQSVSVDEVIKNIDKALDSNGD